MLASDGTRILKFFLHLSREEQKKRLLARLSDPQKRWKFDPQDLKERRHWRAYQKAYEKALAADPNHVRTWSYYGMWQAEQGNRLKAEDYLQKVKLICGTADCEEYRQLRAVIDGTASY